MVDQAVVVERSSASYLIGVLGMLKVKGSNTAFAVFFADQFSKIGL